MTRQEQRDAWRRERQEMLKLQEQGWTLEQIGKQYRGISAAAVHERLKLARKERSQERRRATIAIGRSKWEEI